MNESHRGMVKHILSGMTAKMVAGLMGMDKEATVETRIAFIESVAAEEIVELTKNYDWKIIKEAIRQWEIELEVLLFILNFFSRFTWKPLRTLGTLYALLRYGDDLVDNAIKLGRRIAQK
jgi:hypothetical protein